MDDALKRLDELKVDKTYEEASISLWLEQLMNPRNSVARELAESRIAGHKRALEEVEHQIAMLTFLNGQEANAGG